LVGQPDSQGCWPWLDVEQRLPKRLRARAKKNVTSMYRSWANLVFLAAESQQVIWLRTMKLAAGGAQAEAEAYRMVSEKFMAGGFEMGRLLLGASPDSVVKRYRGKVRANRRRLS
jgi:hypothetical protein